MMMNNQEKLVFGIDIGGTTVKCGLLTESGTLIKKDEIPTRKDNGGSLILDDIAEYINKVIAEDNIDRDNICGIGMGVPGAVKDDGTVNRCVNLGWGVFNAAEVMKDKMKLPVFVGNDANMAALGEYWQGGAKGFDNLVFVTIGTGVGGGVIINGNPVNGNNGAAAEIGHMPIAQDETEYCNCGKKGCLEQVASASGIVRVATRMLNASEEPSSLRKVQYMSAKAVFDEAKAGDGLAVKIVEYVSDYLAKGLACAACMTDPEVFVIGGGVSAAGQYFIDKIKKYYRQYAFHASRETDIILAKLGNDAGMYGAAKLCLSRLNSN